MKITGFTPSDALTFPMFEKETAVVAAAPSHDVISLQSLRMMDMDDAEADALLDETLGMIAQDNVAALSAHGGLTAGRVAELLSL